MIALSSQNESVKIESVKDLVRILENSGIGEKRAALMCALVFMALVPEPVETFEGLYKFHNALLEDE